MTEEETTTEIPIRIVVESIGEGTPISESETLRLTVEGPKTMIAMTAEAVVQFTQLAFGANVKSMTDSEGNDIMPAAPAQVDPLSTGDTSVEG